MGDSRAHPVDGDEVPRIELLQVVGAVVFGATFPEGRNALWNVAQLRREWDEPRRVFLVSVEVPGGSA